MTDMTSIGPAEPPDGASRQNPEITDDNVDAIKANEFEMRHGPSGVEAPAVSEPDERSAAPKSPSPSLPKNEGLVSRPTGAFPPGGQQGAAADREQGRGF